jgi:putative membrane protein
MFSVRFGAGMAAALAAMVVMTMPMGCVRQRLQRMQARIDKRAEERYGDIDLGGSPQSVFSRAATTTNNEAINLSNLAWLRAHSPGVRRFAAQTLAEHSDLNSMLGTINTRVLRIPLPVQKSEVDSERLARLESLSGPEFDQAYLDAVIVNGAVALDLYEFEAVAGVEPNLRAYAARSAPVLASELETARVLAAAMATQASAPTAPPLPPKGEGRLVRFVGK